jgi:hypothetical protein
VLRRPRAGSRLGKIDDGCHHPNDRSWDDHPENWSLPVISRRSAHCSAARISLITARPTTRKRLGKAIAGSITPKAMSVETHPSLYRHVDQSAPAQDLWTVKDEIGANVDAAVHRSSTGCRLFEPQVHRPRSARGFSLWRSTNREWRPRGLARALAVPGGYAAAVLRCCWRRQRMPASMRSSISPSRTAAVLPVSYSVRRSFTI